MEFLASSDTDTTVTVDICITTSYKELENVCSLAEVLANHGMERVVCVSHAKVPIVKIWDPQLKMACDMNVNNTLALENTRMIRTYVDVDDRVRPLAMIVKHWTKQRVLNDAALGGTLSSYTWICLIINFLQTRDPPILPSLQNRPHQTKKVIDGVQVSFDDDLDSLRDFGSSNKQTLGQLLFQFFRYYGHEVDYEKFVISVREGKLISKEGKGWHLLQNNRLCVEEPFNTTRNLGNTADDTSFRGLHIELRQAFKAISEAKLDKCCEQYVFPPEEERVWERPPPQPRPILTPTLSHSSSRGGRGGGRGARFSNQYSRGGSNSTRRSSSATNRTSNSNTFRPHHVQLNPELNIQAQQAQYLLHDQLYQQIQLLQAQEQELRIQLHNQSLLTGRPPPVLIRQPLIQFSFPQQDASTDDNSRSRAGTANQTPLGPIRPGMFYSPAYLPLAAQNVQGSNTNPPSPSLSSAVPDLRRNPRRSSVANGSPGGLRSHSQPARPVHSPVTQNLASLCSPPRNNDNSQSSRGRFHPASPSRTATETDSSLQSPQSSAVQTPTYLEEHRPSDYVGYYVTPQHYQQSLMAMSLPAAHYAQTNAADYRPAVLAYPDPFGAFPDNGYNGQAVPAVSAPRHIAPRDRGPLIIDGSVPPSDNRTPSQSEYSNLAASVPSDVEVGWESPSRTSDAFSNGTQEPTTFEMDALPATNDNTAQPGSAQHTVGSADKGLSAQLQGLRVSNATSIDDSRPGPDRKGAKPGQVNGDSPAKTSANNRHPKPAEKFSSAGNSRPNKESSSISPTKPRTNGTEFEKTNGVHHKGKTRSNQETQSTSSISSLSRRETHPASLPRKPDGLPPITGHTNTNGGWQTTKKKHKRNTKSLAEVQHTNAGESPPLDESLRKGG
ncbi:Poly(A) RNA polymerase cid13 [Talaromyces islandicus]|uniref:polynucleotide adenylyltransferase n=1 Tax=Talaromyces islandicus TaxID=28573 RepID=A0A0U1LWN5_TALIS|nr:Poly(A) RNA polymerase cid13 [Talaromyces islandicus]